MLKKWERGQNQLRTNLCIHTCFTVWRECQKMNDKSTGVRQDAFASTLRWGGKAASVSSLSLDSFL